MQKGPFERLTTTGVGRDLLAAAVCFVALPIAKWASAPAACFVLVVMVCSLYLGRRPALLAAACNGVLFLVFFFPPISSGLHLRASLLRLGISIIAMLFTIETIERRRRSDRLRVLLAETFGSITQTSPDCIFSVSREGQIIFANPAGSLMFGYSESELLTLPLSTLLPTLEPDESPSGELRALPKDKHSFFVEATAGSFGDTTTVFLRDVSDRMRIEDSLRLTQTKLAKASQIAAVAELSASIAHEISQPISAMVANGQAALRWLQSQPVSLDDARAAVERIVRDGKDAREIIDRLRSLYKRSVSERRPVSLPIIFMEVKALLNRRAELAQILLEVDVSSDLPLVIGDKLQLQQVILNLITNGMDALEDTEQGPKRITVRARVDGPSVRAEVEDSGQGLTEFETIFDSFVTTKAKGMGMGLSICKSIIEDHGGRIWGSPAPGRGSIFSFILPRKLGVYSAP